jgi:methionine-R-sulfoxide reductase
MKRLIYFILLISFSGCSQSQNNSPNKTAMKEQLPEGQIPKTEAEWKERLSAEQYGVLRMKGTERPGTGQFLYHKEKGIYTCGGCGAELFSSDMKFDSHCGWPSFDRELEGGKIKQIRDFSHGMIRTEIVCARCGGHLGHIFDDGPTETGMRYCVNSLSLGFKKTE